MNLKFLSRNSNCSEWRNPKNRKVVCFRGKLFAHSQFSLKVGEWLDFWKDKVVDLDWTRQFEPGQSWILSVIELILITWSLKWIIDPTPEVDWRHDTETQRKSRRGALI